MTDRGERRNKGKDKKREKKKYPYVSGGKFRLGNINLKESQLSSKRKKKINFKGFKKCYLSKKVTKEKDL